MKNIELAKNLIKEGADKSDMLLLKKIEELEDKLEDMQESMKDYQDIKDKLEASSKAQNDLLQELLTEVKHKSIPVELMGLDQVIIQGKDGKDADEDRIVQRVLDMLQ
jgi:hypothetical protein